MSGSGKRLPAKQNQKRPQWVIGGATIVTFVALLYLVELIDLLIPPGHTLDDHGIVPLTSDGLSGIIFAPLLHANWAHLMANTIPLLVLGFLMTLSGISRFVWATAIIWIVGGFGTWLIGDVGSTCRPTDHIGASGLIFGYLTFLLVFGFFARKLSHVVVGLAVFFLYGGVLLGAMPVLHQCGGVSWQGHLCGGIAGVLAAYLLTSPERNARAQKRALKR